jgi:hypothetical protein
VVFFFPPFCILCFGAAPCLIDRSTEQSFETVSETPKSTENHVNLMALLIRWRAGSRVCTPELADQLHRMLAAFLRSLGPAHERLFVVATSALGTLLRVRSRILLTEDAGRLAFVLFELADCPLACKLALLRQLFAAEEMRHVSSAVLRFCCAQLEKDMEVSSLPSSASKKKRTSRQREAAAAPAALTASTEATLHFLCDMVQFAPAATAQVTVATVGPLLAALVPVLDAAVASAAIPHIWAASHLLASLNHPAASHRPAALAALRAAWGLLQTPSLSSGNATPVLLPALGSVLSALGPALPAITAADIELYASAAISFPQSSSILRAVVQ